MHELGGLHASMIVDSNDDIHIAHADTLGYYDLLFTTVQGTGKGLTPNPVFTITPNLPSGLVLNWKTGTISGTPTEVHANTTHTVTVTTLGTTTQGTLALYVTGAPGPIAYVDLTASTGSTITPLTPTLTSTATSGAVTSWAINATLPTGLTFETSNGTIWGTPSPDHRRCGVHRLGQQFGGVLPHDREHHDQRRAGRWDRLFWGPQPHLPSHDDDHDAIDDRRDADLVGHPSKSALRAVVRSEHGGHLRYT